MNSLRLKSTLFDEFMGLTLTLVGWFDIHVAIIVVFVEIVQHLAQIFHVTENLSLFSSFSRKKFEYFFLVYFSKAPFVSLLRENVCRCLGFAETQKLFLEEWISWLLIQH